MKDIISSVGNYKQYFEGLDFPASKTDIVNHLQAAALQSRFEDV